MSCGQLPPGVLPARTDVIVADLDGTLAFHGAPPGPAVTAQLIRLAAGRGARLVLATSRSPRGTRRLLGSLTDAFDLICCNGALWRDTSGTGGRVCLPRDAVVALARGLRGAGLDFCVEYGDWFWASSVRTLPWMGQHRRVVGLSGAVPPPGPVVKVAVADAAGRMGPVRSAAGPRARLFPHERTGDVDVTPAGVDKAVALRALLGPDGGRFTALGNDVNDLGLLRAADQAVVVGGRLPGLLGAAGRGRAVLRVPAVDGAVAAVLATAGGGDDDAPPTALGPALRPVAGRRLPPGAPART
ncbi:HAD family hydrolase [Streptomyces boninensis]|uniref:HAD family hydrolase n=1 Tax=Streptomyces boninensis TaxID=2039455 RepID=UPI003B217373